MSAWGSAAAVSGLLLVSSVLLTSPGPSRTPPRSDGVDESPARSAGGGVRRLLPGVGRPAGNDDELRAAAVAERAAALLRAGVTPAAAWAHALDAGAGAGAGENPASAPTTTAPVRAVWELVQRTGAPAAEALEASAAGVRADAAARAAVRTALAGARVSARTVSALPLLGVLLGAALGAEPWAVLLGTGLGRVCAVVGVALLALGRWWSARLVRTAEAAGR